MHVADQDLGMIGGMGIVAAGLPIAAGAAFAAAFRGEDRVAVTFFGDGAVHQGAFHEALDFAACSRFRSSSSARTTSTPRRRPSTTTS